MKILVGCECSGRVALAFATLGHDAVSCDLKVGEIGGVVFKNGGKYKHVKADIFEVIDSEHWDIFICHPPCTFIAGSGARWLDDVRYPDRRKDLEKGIEFAEKLWNCGVKRICMENPVGQMSTFGDGYLPKIGRPSQIVQPWQFGEEYQKSTCLWLKNLPMLQPTKIVDKGEFYITSGGNKIPKWYSDAKSSNLELTRTIRSRTSIGIANAMASQWSRHVEQSSEMNKLFEV